MTTTHERGRIGRMFERATYRALAIGAAAVGLLWAWNRTLAELASLPEIQFKHALALALALFVAGWLVAAGARLGRRRPADA